MNIRQNTRTIVAAAFVIAIMTMLGSVGCSDSNGNGGPDTTDVDTCHFFPESWTWGGMQTIIQEAETIYNFPCANPNNPDEFAYLRYDNQYISFELRKHNLQTGADMLLCNTVPTYSPGWAGNGKIYFGNSGLVYEVDAMTGNLTTVNAQGALYDPRVGRNNGKMICRYEPPGGIENAYIAVLSTSGQVTDSIGKNIGRYAWVNDTAIIVVSPDDSFRILSYPSLQVRLSGSLPYGHTLIAHYEGTRFITSGAGSLRYLDYATGQVTPIIGPCGDRYSYGGNSALSGDKSRIISVRTHNEIVDTTGWQHVYSTRREMVAVTLPAVKLQYIPLP